MSTPDAPRPGPNWPTDPPPRRGIRYIPDDQIMSMVELEQYINELTNESIRAEIARRDLNDHLLDCLIEYERARVSAEMDPDCPRPSRGGEIITVAQRDAYIRGTIIDEWSAWEQAKTNLENQDRYLKNLERILSAQQTKASMAKTHYQTATGRDRN